MVPPLTILNKQTKNETSVSEKEREEVREQKRKSIHQPGDGTPVGLGFLY